jgi:curved DNA-binding protein CbpA
MPATLAILYCTEEDIQHLLSEAGEQASIDDDGDDALTSFEQANVTRAISYGTTRVNFYCQPLYDTTDLSTSWLANEWATIIASRWLRTRRGNPCPKSLQDMYDEAIKDMEKVKKEEMQIPDIGKRNPDWPAWSNVSVSNAYRFKKIRVERPISERTPTQYPQNPDWGAEFCWEI